VASNLRPALEPPCTPGHPLGIAAPKPSPAPPATDDTIVRPGPKPADEPHLFFCRGKGYPRAIAWLGFTSFWGHVWHLAASVVATEDIDARDWMRADHPFELTERVARRLLGEDAFEQQGEPPGGGESLTELLDGDLWIDFIADSGDDAAVSEAVADMVFQPYRVPDGAEGEAEIVAPRGHILLFGGDTAYPVATELEIHNRVCVPFNKVLRERIDREPRVLMGIPGNHDWYDGLDGFRRLFRARDEELDRASIVQADQIDPNTQIGQLIDWVEAFRVGHHVSKRPTLPLFGYDTVQQSSYWLLQLAPRLDLWGVDRQLRVVNESQQRFFQAHRDEHPDHAKVLVISDPAYAMLEPYPIGQRILQSLAITFEHDEPLVLTGDTHHYCRQRFGRGMHVIAGGGGAFLHPARIDRKGFSDPDAEFPGPRASFALAMQVPWQIAGGRAGFVVHVALALLYLPILGTLLANQDASVASAVIAVIATFACGMIGGWRQNNGLVIGALAAGVGLWVGALPWVMNAAVGGLGAGHLGHTAQSFLAYFLSIYPGALGFGTFLMVLTILGLEQHQAFSALANPGYKHFLRLRIRKDGSAIDGWVLGKVDTLAEDAEIVLIDRWTWNNPRHDPHDRPAMSADAAEE